MAKSRKKQEPVEAPAPVPVQQKIEEHPNIEPGVNPGPGVVVAIIPEDAPPQPDEEGNYVIQQQADRAEVLKKLWDDYFAAPKAKKGPIMEQYNKLAKEYNQIAGFTCMTIITSSTKDSVKTRPVNTPTIVKDGQPVLEPKKGSIIEQILDLHKQGKTNKEIIAMGYNKSTVGRQVSEYKKRENK